MLRLAVILAICSLACACGGNGKSQPETRFPIANAPSPVDALQKENARLHEQIVDSLKKENYALRSQVSELQGKLDQAYVAIKAWKEWADKQRQNQSEQRTTQTANADVNVKAWRRVPALTFSSMEVGMVGPFAKSIKDFRIEKLVTPQFGLLISAKTTVNGEKHYFVLNMSTRNLSPGVIGDQMPGVYRVVSKSNTDTGKTFFHLEVHADE